MSITAVALCVSQAHGSQMVVTVTGTVSGGLDTTGMFGPVGANLAGDNFTVVYTIDDANGQKTIYHYPLSPPSSGAPYYSSGAPYYSKIAGSGPTPSSSPVTAILTINSGTYSFNSNALPVDTVASSADRSLQYGLAENFSNGESYRVGDAVGAGQLTIGLMFSPSCTISYDVDVPIACPITDASIGAFSFMRWHGIPPVLDMRALGFLVPKNVTMGGGAAAPSPPEPPPVADALGDPLDTPGCACAGDPINIGTGNLFEQVADYATAGPNKLIFKRYYNSRGSIDYTNTFAITLGANWRSTYDRYLKITSTDGRVTALSAERADGQVLSFTLQGSDWTSKSDVDVRVTPSGATWTLTDQDDTVEMYSAVNPGEARLTTIQARNGYTQSLTYNLNNQLVSVSDSFGRTLSFTYQNGLLQTVTTPDSLVFTYGYSASMTSARLASVAYSTTLQTSQSYLYENTAFPFALTGLIDEDGNRFASWTYDAQGRVTSSQHAGGADLTTVTYNDSDGSRAITNALGVTETYRFTTLHGVPKVTEVGRAATSTTAVATRKITYDANGYVATQTDWNGNLTSYVNDGRGQPTIITEAAGTAQSRTTAITYHANFHLPMQTVAPGLTTTFTYDTRGELLTRTETDTMANIVAYSTSGTQRIWTYIWSNFLLAAAKGPRTDVAIPTSFAYDGSGSLIAVTNALGQVTRITRHLPGGLPQTIIDPNGVATQFDYDARLRLHGSTIITSTGQFVTSTTYDPAGNVIGITLPDGAALAESYDAAHRLVRIADRFGQHIDYVLDALGDRTQTDIASTTAVTRKHADGFDALGRVLKDIGGAGQITSYTYDADGNALTITNPLGRVTQRSFDLLSRLVSIRDPTGGTTGTAYDAHDRPVSVTDANGSTTSYIYDGFGRVIQRLSPDTGTTVYRYDLADNLVQTLDARGIVTNHAYDAVNRQIATTYPDNAAENVAYQYDEPGRGFGIGRLTTVADAAGMLKRVYDERGNVTSETRVIDGVTLSTGFSYDAASRVTALTYPSGLTITYTRDKMGRIATASAKAPSATAAMPVVASIGYEPFGPAARLTYGNGITETRSFDLDYRLTGLADAGASAVQNLAYVYDAANNVMSIADAVTPANSQAFGYDALDRLTSAKGGYGSLGYSYDAVGNRLTATTGGVAGTTYAYAAHSNRLTTITADSVTQSFAYTETGNIAEINSGADTVTLLYDQANRLTHQTLPTRNVFHYTYDAFGHRLVNAQSVGMVATTLYQYDGAGALLEERSSRPNLITDYVYLGGRPIATLSSNTRQLSFIHTDSLGTPQLATDARQVTVWRATYQPFGAMSDTAGLITQNLRLPGQYGDAETGFYQSWFRDYAPVWGRYLESDPIGLRGGLNTYAYVGGNPITNTDRSGNQVYSEPDMISLPPSLQTLLRDINQQYDLLSQAPNLSSDPQELDADLKEIGELYSEYTRSLEERAREASWSSYINGPFCTPYTPMGMPPTICPNCPELWSTPSDSGP